MDLALLKDKKLSEKEEDEIFKHLLACEDCSNILKVADELEREETTIKPVNNPDYKGIIKHFIPFAAAVVIFLGVPQGYKYFNPHPSMKGIFVDKNIFEESMMFWGKVYEKIMQIKEDIL